MPSVEYGGKLFSSKVRKNMNGGTPSAAATVPPVARAPFSAAASTKKPAATTSADSRSPGSG